MRSRRPLRLPAPYLKQVRLRPERVERWAEYPFSLPWLSGRDFEFRFSKPITIIVGENGTGKSTFLEAIARIIGFDEAGGGPGYAPVDHSSAVDVNGGRLAEAFAPSWLPRISAGWFFRAETFFSVARYLDQAAIEGLAAPPDFLSHSHGESFLRFFEERCTRQGIYIFDEPESALSPRRQIEFLKLLRRMERSTLCQVIMATHSPLLMAYPEAQFLTLSKDGFAEGDFTRTGHFRTMQAFFADPEGFMAEAFEEE
ncbi:MAG: AAA family ATPase [Proteobacteria bacterium]|nr:AAA family ATPase [Pseudomonadota bacterium]